MERIQGVKFLCFPFYFFIFWPASSYFLRVLLGALKQFQIFEIKLALKLINTTKKKKTESPTVCEKDHFEDCFRFHDFLLKLVPRLFQYFWYCACIHFNYVYY